MNGRHRHDPKGHITVETKSSRLFRLCRMAQPVIFAVLTLAPVCALEVPGDGPDPSEATTSSSFGATISATGTSARTTKA
jgi:hypothetical protein